MRNFVQKMTHSQILGMRFSNSHTRVCKMGDKTENFTCENDLIFIKLESQGGKDEKSFNCDSGLERGEDT